MKTHSKRATIFFDPKVFRAIKIKAIETNSSVSTIVSAAIKQYLGDDEADLASFHERAKEPETSFEQVVKKLTRDGKI